VHAIIEEKPTINRNQSAPAISIFCRSFLCSLIRYCSFQAS